jgi:hypothetical protein
MDGPMTFHIFTSKLNLLTLCHVDDGTRHSSSFDWKFVTEKERKTFK